MTELGDRRDIQTCREHHAHIGDLLARAPAISVDAVAELAEMLAALKTMLLRHLKFEDDHLYPRLARSTDANVVETARRFQSEMGGLAPQCVAFFARWPDAESISRNLPVFVSEWTAVRTVLERRILAEDDELYELAERA